MASQFRSAGAQRARSELAVLKAFCGGALALLGYAGLTFPAIGPAYGDLGHDAVPTASLSRSGDDLVITGSIDHMFEGATFSGPNRSEKQDRLRSTVGIMEFTSGFADIRARLAALRAPKSPEPKVDPRGGLVPEPVVVASIDPKIASEALDAIESMAPDLVVPKRRPESDLAYAPDAGGLDSATDLSAPTKGKDGKKWSQKEMWCLATAIYFESRGEKYRGQVAVGQVVMNRVKHRLYPSTICGVVFQNQQKRNACQFSFACDGIPERVTEQKSWKQAQEIAKGIVDGSLYLSEVGYATHYHATYVYPHWAPRMKKVTKIGLHVFYQFKRGWKFG
jgi:spore germination cell wall hydrolase CwlJ-like protein